MLDSSPGWLSLLDGESQLSQHPYCAGLPALEVTGGKALACGELIGCTQDRLRRVRGKGAIVNVGTMAAEFGMPGTSLYRGQQGRTRPAHEGVGGRVRPERGPGQRRQPGTHPDRGDSGAGRGDRRARGAGSSRAVGFTGRDRRSDHLPGFRRRQLRSRRDPRCRRRPHSGLTDTGIVASTLTPSGDATARPSPASPTTLAGREVTRRRRARNRPALMGCPGCQSTRRSASWAARAAGRKGWVVALHAC